MTTEIKLTDSERSTIRKSLLGAGIKTRGMTDADLHGANTALETTPTAPIVEDIPAPAPKPKKRTNGDTAPTAPIVEAAPIDPITKAINDAIK